MVTAITMTYADEAIGVVIRGETYHFEIVAGESARGIMALTMDGLAVGNGILTVENEAQALVRADPKQANKGAGAAEAAMRSEEHTSELQSLMRISYAVFCLKKKTTAYTNQHTRMTKATQC